MDVALTKDSYYQTQAEYKLCWGYEKRWRIAACLLNILLITTQISLIAVVILQSRDMLMLNSYSTMALAFGPPALSLFSHPFLYPLCQKKIELYSRVAAIYENTLYYLHLKLPIILPPPPIKPPQLPSTFSLNVAYYCSLPSCDCWSTPFPSIPNTTLIPSQNHGRKADIPRFTLPVSEKHALAFSAIAQDLEMTVTPTLTLEPFGDGVCDGATLLFARDFFHSHNLEATAEKFQAGAPYDAVVLQAMSHKLTNGYITTSPPCMPVSRIHILTNIAGLAIPKLSGHFFAVDAMINAFVALSNGVYYLTFPASETSNHSILFIRSNNQNTLFDPSFGTLTSIPEKSLQNLFSTFFSHYDLSPKKKLPTKAFIFQLNPAKNHE